MRLFDDIGNTLKSMQVYLFGKGFMTLAMLAVGFAAHGAAAWIMPAVLIGGVALTAVNRFYREGLYQDQMVDLYRDDIAAELGIAPEQVGRMHLKIAARENEVLDQALKRQRNKTWVAIGTAALSGAISWTLVGIFGVNNELHEAATKLFNSGIAGTIANFVGIGTVSAITGLIFNTGLRGVIEGTTSVGKAAAHDRILELDFDLKHGRAVSKEQVYAVIVAGNAPLQHSIQQSFHESYDHMNPRERAAVIDKIGIPAELQALADSVNRGEIRPGKLAYMLDETYHPEHAATRFSLEEAPQPARSNFVDRLGLAPRHQQSYRAQVDADRATLAERSV